MATHDDNGSAVKAAADQHGAGRSVGSPGQGPPSGQIPPEPPTRRRPPIPMDAGPPRPHGQTSGTVVRGGAAAPPAPVELEPAFGDTLPVTELPEPLADLPFDPTDWTLNTPAIQVGQASCGGIAQHELNDDERVAAAFATNPELQLSPEIMRARAALAQQASLQAAAGHAPGRVAAAPNPIQARDVIHVPASPPGSGEPEVDAVSTRTLPHRRKGAQAEEQKPASEGPDPYLGTTIGDRYVLDDILGEGGMGRVYLAHHKVIGKRLAIKVLHAELVRDKEALGRFLREARAASSIGNPHIVDISDFGELPDGSTYFVMEFLDGQTLGDVLEERGSLPVELVTDIALQLCDGLAAAHAREIVHRDLKPENVTLITQGTHKNFCKILDFGIAKVSGAGHAERLTMAGAVFGTPHYMSPEQAAGAAVDHRTDIYSLGVMMYEMTSGQLPFNADNFMGILTQHMYKAPVPIRAIVSAPECPPGLEAIILKCLSKKPDGRYGSTTELAADLEKLKAGQIPDAVHEMMARSGSFNVPADYFKTAGTTKAIAPELEMARRRSPARFAWIAAVVICVGIALFVVLRDSIGTAQPQPGSDATPGATEVTNPTGAADTPTAKTNEKLVMLAAEPAEAAAWRDGLKVDLPASISVPDGEPVVLEIRLDGFEPQMVTLDGSEPRKVVKLKKLTARTPYRPRGKLPPTGTGKAGSPDVVDPWAKNR